MTNKDFFPDDLFYSAYLLAWVDITKFPLTVSLSIHSDDASNITRVQPCLVFTVHKARGKSYEHARQKIIDDINSSLLYKELRPYFHPVIGPQLDKEVDKYINNLPSIMAKVLGGKDNQGE